MTAVVVVLALVAYVQLTAGWKEGDKPVVMIRLDGVAVRSCEKMSKAAIDAVLAKNTSINIGVIAKDLDSSAHKSFASYLQSVSQNSFAEIVSNSYSHTPYSDKDYEWQINDILNAQDVLKRVFGNPSTAFIPPMNEFDTGTLAAVLAEPSLKVFSSECIWNQNTPGTVISCPSPGAVIAPNIAQDGIHHVPAGAVLGGLNYWDNKLLQANLSEAIKWVESQILNQNFSVVLLEPLEFTTNTECVSIDNAKISVLEDLIDYGKDKWQFMTFREAAMYYANDTTLFDVEGEKADAKFEYQAKLNTFFVVIIFAMVTCICCISFFRTSTEQKVQRKDREAEEARRKRDINAKLKVQRMKRDVEMATSSGQSDREKKKMNRSEYSMI